MKWSFESFPAGIVVSSVRNVGLVMICTYREATSDTTKPTKELVAFADNNLVHLDLTIIFELERKVRVV